MYYSVSDEETPKGVLSRFQRPNEDGENTFAVNANRYILHANRPKAFCLLHFYIDRQWYD